MPYFLRYSLLLGLELLLVALPSGGFAYARPQAFLHGAPLASAEILPLKPQCCKAPITRPLFSRPWSLSPQSDD